VTRALRADPDRIDYELLAAQLAALTNEEVSTSPR